MDPLDRRAETIGPRAFAVDCRVDTVDCRAETIGPRAFAVDCRVDTVDCRAETIGPWADGVEPRVDTVDCRVDTVDCRAETIGPWADGVEPRADTVDCRAEAIGPRADTVDCRVDTVDCRSDRLGPRAFAVDCRADPVGPWAETIGPGIDMVGPWAETIGPGIDPVGPWAFAVDRWDEPLVDAATRGVTTEKGRNREFADLGSMSGARASRRGRAGYGVDRVLRGRPPHAFCSITTRSEANGTPRGFRTHIQVIPERVGAAESGARGSIAAVQLTVEDVTPGTMLVSKPLPSQDLGDPAPPAPLDEHLVRVRAAAETLPVFVWSARGDGTSDYYNPAFLEYLGKRPDEMGPSAWVETIHPDDRAAGHEAWEIAHRTGAPYSIELRIRGASDGAYRWFVSRAHPVRGDDGRVLRWMGTVVDVHHRVEAERAARAAAEEKLRRTTMMLDALLEASPAAVWAKDLEGRYLFVNPRGAANLGQPAAAFVGKTDGEIAGPEIAAALRANDRRVLETNRSYEIEEVLDAPGGPRTVLSIKFPLRDETGSIYAVAGVATDITDRKRMEAALRESEERARERAEELSSILATMPASIWIARDPGCRSVTGSRFAHAAMRVPEGSELSKTAPDASHLSHFRVFHEGKELAPEEMPLQRAARGEEIHAFENDLVFDDGTRLRLYGSAAPLRDPHGQPRGAVGAFVDVTALRAAEEEREDLLAREQTARAVAEAESRAKDEFLAAVSHELQSPLDAILGWTQVMLARGLEDPKLVEDVARIEASARLQARLVEDILDASRSATGKLRIDARPTELVPIVQMVVEALKPAADAKGIGLSISLDPLTGPVVGDAQRLQQVAWNLVSNAVKFTPEGGGVTVTLAGDGRDARLEVRDTGIGIAPDFVPFLFRPFRQADPSGVGRHGGLGLGLSIVQHIVELHGGSIGAESGGPGQGATFTVLLPLAAKGSAAPGAATASVRGARVLIVDDEPPARALLARILGDHGAVVRACASATEALDDLVVWRPDVLVADIRLHERDGCWLMERVRALPPERGGATPALALTQSTSIADRVRALSHGYQLHVSKPLDVDELIPSIAALLSWPKRT